MSATTSDELGSSGFRGMWAFRRCGRRRYNSGKPFGRAAPWNQVDSVHMGTLARDTDSSAQRAQIEILRSLPAWRKLELLADCCETNRALMMAGLRSRFPDASEAELQRMLMDLVWGEEEAARAWGRLHEAR